MFKQASNSLFERQLCSVLGKRGRSDSALSAQASVRQSVLGGDSLPAAYFKFFSLGLQDMSHYEQPLIRAFDKMLEKKMSDFPSMGFGGKFDPPPENIVRIDGLSGSTIGYVLMVLKLWPDANKHTMAQAIHMPVQVLEVIEKYQLPGFDRNVESIARYPGHREALTVDVMRRLQHECKAKPFSPKAIADRLEIDLNDFAFAWAFEQDNKFVVKPHKLTDEQQPFEGRRFDGGVSGIKEADMLFGHDGVIWTAEGDACRAEDLQQYRLV